MTQALIFSDPTEQYGRSETIWGKLSLSLRPYISHLVYSAGIPSWSGQQAEIIEDILQETMLRTLRYIRQAELGMAAPIDSLEGLSKTIASHYYQDLRRRDWRLVRDEQGTSSPESSAGTPVAIDLSEVALNNVILENLFVRVALEIVQFPYKQLRALLIDLANRMHFDVTPTALQRAFLAVGIRLQDYRQALPNDPVMRSRHASLVNLAYKRVKACMQQYVLKYELGIF